MRRNEENPIAPTLKSLKINETAKFPLSMSQSVRSTIQALKTQFFAERIDFTTSKNAETGMLEVKKIA